MNSSTAGRSNRFLNMARVRSPTFRAEPIVNLGTKALSHRVERFFNGLEQFRQIPTRYDKPFAGDALCLNSGNHVGSPGVCDTRAGRRR